MAQNEGFTHNIDLRLSGATGEAFEKRFRQFLFAFSDPDLQAMFDPLDKKALHAKRRARTWGMISVVLITFSLIVAALDIAFAKQPWFNYLIMAAVAAGIAGVLIGFVGIMVSGSKEEWLRQRFICERIRQLHFQTLVRWAPMILAAAKSENYDAFFKARSDRTAEFRAQVEQPSAAKLGALLAERDEEPWMVEPKGGPLPEGADTDLYLSALRELRLTHQINYVEKQLMPDGSLIPNSPIERQKVLTGFTVFCVIAILILHILSLLGVLHIGVLPEQKPAIHVATLVLAILALAARTVEEGLQAHHEVERYRGYLGGLRRIKEHLKTATTNEERLEQLSELEEISYGEMVNFLKSHHEAKFVM